MKVRILTDLAGSAVSVLLAILPVAAAFATFQLWFLKLPRAEVVRIAAGTALAAAGLCLFLLGVSLGFMPFGRAIGEAIGGLPNKWLPALLGLVLGFVTTWGEPAVRILAGQVEQASVGSIRQRLVMIAICLGVAAAVGLGLVRIGQGFPIAWLLVPGYLIVIAAIWLSDPEFVSIAVDAGGVATGPLANTFLLALALGVSSAANDRDPLVHGLGLVALIALAPILSVLMLGLLVRWKARRRSFPT